MRDEQQLGKKNQTNQPTQQALSTICHCISHIWPFPNSIHANQTLFWHDSENKQSSVTATYRYWELPPTLKNKFSSRYIVYNHRDSCTVKIRQTHKFARQLSACRSPSPGAEKHCPKWPPGRRRWRSLLQTAFPRSRIYQRAASSFRLGHFNKVEQKYRVKPTFLDFPYFWGKVANVTTCFTLFNSTTNIKSIMLLYSS